MVACMAFEHILKLVPQQKPFRFIDEILEISEDHIVGTYQFKKEEYFYEGHFPSDPVTPGVILIEAMAQTGVVAFGLYLHSLKSETNNSPLTTFFTDCQIEFYHPVFPGEKVYIKGEKLYFRKMKLQTKVTMVNDKGIVLSEGVVTGMGVRRG